MKFLLTGFDPFGGEIINPAFEAVRNVCDTIADFQIVKLELPTVYGKSAKVLDEAIKKHKPDFVLAIGQAGGRSALAVERVGINVDDARIKDNEGNQPIDETICTDGQTAYFSNLPIKAMVEAMQEEGIPSVVSNSAGTFVCNHILYSIMYLIDKKYPTIKGGFIHVPFIPEQVVAKPNQSSMALEMITKGLEIAIETAIKQIDDKKIVGGSIY